MFLDQIVDQTIEIDLDSMACRKLTQYMLKNSAVPGASFKSCTKYRSSTNRDFSKLTHLLKQRGLLLVPSTCIYNDEITIFFLEPLHPLLCNLHRICLCVAGGSRNWSSINKLFQPFHKSESHSYLKTKNRIC